MSRSPPDVQASNIGIGSDMSHWMLPVQDDPADKGSQVMSLSQRSFPLIYEQRVPALGLQLGTCASATVVTVHGELDITTTHLLTELVDSLVRQPAVAHLHLILDLAGVSFFCAHGIRALLYADRAVQSVAGRLTLRSPSLKVRRVLDITSDSAFFEILDAARKPTLPYTSRPCSRAGQH
jgi:anti-anti-sigma factor